MTNVSRSQHVVYAAQKNANTWNDLMLMLYTHRCYTQPCRYSKRCSAELLADCPAEGSAEYRGMFNDHWVWSGFLPCSDFQRFSMVVIAEADLRNGDTCFCDRHIGYKRWLYGICNDVFIRSQAAMVHPRAWNILISQYFCAKGSETL